MKTDSRYTEEERYKFCLEQIKKIKSTCETAIERIEAKKDFGIVLAYYQSINLHTHDLMKEIGYWMNDDYTVRKGA